LKIGVFVQVCDGDAHRMFTVDDVVRRIEQAESLGYDPAWP
jgi:hypothetical protein